MTAKEIRNKAMYASKEILYRTMRKLGFIIEGDSVKNKDEMLSQIYSKQELLKMLDLKDDFIGDLKFAWIFRTWLLGGHFKLNYYETWMLIKHDEKYVWDMYDRLGYL